jgi:hypothetical protein
MVPEMASACVFVGDLSPVQRPGNRAGQRQMARKGTEIAFADELAFGLIASRNSAMEKY